MMLGLPNGGVDVVDSDPNWSVVAAGLATQVGNALGASAGVVEHVGSTAVPGLAAKPIIDLAVELAPDAEPNRVIEALEGIGLVYRGYRSEVGDWLFHCQPNENWCSAIVHVVDYGHPGLPSWLTVR